jgi:predicted chitinase
MSAWKDFLDDVFGPADQPGKVMICFMNRYLEGLDGIKYKIKFDGQERSGTTTSANYCIELTPKSFKPVETYVWSRKALAYKKLDDVTPDHEGRKKLVRKVMKTFKVEGKTEKLPKAATPAKRPSKPTPPLPPGPSPTTPQGVDAKQGKNESEQPLVKATRPVPGVVTIDQVRKIWPSKSNEVINRLRKAIDEINGNLPAYHLDTPLRRAHFFAQVREESGPGFRFFESLDYDAERLLRSKAEAKRTGKKPSPFSYFLKPEHRDEALLFGRTNAQPANQEAIANRVYAKKIGNGSISSGDGWKFRGRGLKQLTGRDNYEKFNENYPSVWNEGLDFVENPELLLEAKYAVRSAAWFWLHHKLYEIADQGSSRKQVDAITSIINQHTDSYEARWNHFNKAAWPAFR